MEGRKEVVSLAVAFDENLLPMGYKIRVNDYISQVRPEARGMERGGEPSGSKSASMKAAVTKPAQSPAKAPPKNDDWPSPEEAAGISSTPSASSAPAPAKPEAAKQADDDFDLNLPS
jgi:hypothetical protein